jgi:methylated-DNA-[protein]-cysteine S-methyltransferase
MSVDKFSDRVKNIVQSIPKGSTMSYKEVATNAGNPNAARAVAKLMSSNYDESIPCHRVICSNGNIGGYNRGGEVKKKSILEKEQLH